MQLRALFQEKKSETEKTSIINLNISQLTDEVKNYLYENENLSKMGYRYSLQDNKFSLKEELVFGMSIGSLMLGIAGFIVIPGNFIFKTICIGGILGVGLYKLLSQNDGIYSNKIKYIKEKTEDLQILLKNDQFKVSLIVNIEKDFLVLENKFQNNEETLKLVKNKKAKVIHELKNLLIEEDVKRITEIYTILKEIKILEEETQKLLKLDLLNHEINKKLNDVGIETSLDEEAVTQKIKSLL